jgi:3-hydroxyacyl-CoA dehydrogenase / 3-hydroxy-2-methylbutyryl-CoA dehydrogenase
MARDLARHRIRVVAIAPGIFESPMYRRMGEKARTELLSGTEWPRRLGMGAEFAEAAVSSVENEMWNGCILRLDGAVRLGKL